MVPTAWIYAIQFRFWPSRLHQHLHPHSAYHLGSRTYPLPPNCTGTSIYTWTTCTDYRIRAASTNKWLHHFVHATFYTTTFLVYPLLTTCTLYWITTNTSATYTTRPSCSLLQWLLTFSAYHEKPWFYSYLMPLFSTLFFHSLSLLIKSSAVSAITAKSSAYNSSQGKETLKMLKLYPHV